LSVKVKRASRYELKPNAQQRILLARHAGAARFAYNWGLQQRIELDQRTGKSTNYVEQNRGLNRLKKTAYSWSYADTFWSNCRYTFGNGPARRAADAMTGMRMPRGIFWP
jgi:transposase